MIWRSLQNSALSLLTLGLGACATTESYKPIQLPAFAGAYFGECSGKDGSVSIEVFSNGRVEQNFDVDWTSDLNGDWGIASYSPLGQTLFQLDFVHKPPSFKQTGKAFADLENLSVGNQNLINLEGHEVGLRADEVTCLLNHKIPQRWLRRIVEDVSDNKEIKYIISDSGRTINLALNKHGNRSEEYWKADIDWSLYWGFKKMQLSVKLLRDEQALVIHSDQYDKVDVRILAQEE